MIKIIKTDSNFEREPFLAPFGFKGKYLDELWQTVALMESSSGCRGLGIGAQSVLWSDASVFSGYSQSAGNSLMFLLTEHALKKAAEMEFETPLDLLDRILPAVFEYGKRITCNKDLRKTFALNALVAVDNAAWLLYCNENGIKTFEDMIPKDVRPALSSQHYQLAAIPLITYNISPMEIKRLTDKGLFFMKIKIGSDPEKDGDLDKMLDWDKKRLTDIHEIMKDKETPYTSNGKIPYYLDANGRYDTKERLMRLLEHADDIGALDRILLLEEPFPEEYKTDVSDIPVRLAADESAHSDADTRERIEMGYKAIALKPIAKTLSMSFRIVKAAYEKGIPCFCADLTVNPILVEWNKNMAVRLAALPGLKVGVLESNGPQNYSNWGQMRTYHPYCNARWMDAIQGMYNLDADFYCCSGGILEPGEHYEKLVHGAAKTGKKGGKV